MHKGILNISSGVFLTILSFSVIAKANIETLPPMPAEIEAIMNKPLYKNGKWGLRVINQKTGNVLLDLNSDLHFFIASVRKIFTVGELLNKIGPEHRTVTRIFHDGKVQGGALHGNLILVASGDLTMGGRTLKNGEIALTQFDHNEANALGNAQLTDTNPLAGYQNLARQVKNSGIDEIKGDVVIDDRLFEAFNFRNEFFVTPAFVNDDVIDVMIKPDELKKKVLVDWHPKSVAFKVTNQLKLVTAQQKYRLEMNPVRPECIGKTNCYGVVKGQLPLNFVPPLTHSYPLIQTFRITKPSDYARTVFIESLEKAGVDVSKVQKLKPNPKSLLKSNHPYQQNNQVAMLESLPYKEDAKFILKVSYNIGADLSLMLLGLNHDKRTMAESLMMEKALLKKQYHLSPSDYHFIDGSGDGETTAKNTLVTKWLALMSLKPSFDAFFKAMPILGIDGSLGFVNDFRKDQTLAGAAGHVHAKTGTYVASTESGMMLKGQALAGYIQSKSGQDIIFHLVVNNVPIQSINDVIEVFQDQGKIAAILWRDY